MIWMAAQPAAPATTQIAASWDGTATAITIAALIGGISALVELLARYRDDPARAILSVPAAAYAVINAVAAILAGWWLVLFQFSLVADPQYPHLVSVARLAVIAGFGSLLVMRTSLLRLRMPGGDEISVGPAVIVEQLLSVIDRGVDRHLAVRRAQIASVLAPKIDFTRHNSELVSLCLVLLQNPTADEEQRMTAVSRALAGRNDIDDRVKAMSLILALLGLVGETVLVQAVDAINDRIPGANP